MADTSFGDFVKIIVVEIVFMRGIYGTILQHTCGERLRSNSFHAKGSTHFSKPIFFFITNIPFLIRNRHRLTIEALCRVSRWDGYLSKFYLSVLSLPIIIANNKPLNSIDSRTQLAIRIKTALGEIRLSFISYLSLDHW